MSVHATSWVLKNSEARLGDRLVLLSLADHAHADGTQAFPSVATMAAEARLTRRQVQRCLRNLVEHGHIEMTGQHYSGAAIYMIHMGGVNMSPGVKSSQNLHDNTPEPSEPSVKGGGTERSTRDVENAAGEVIGKTSKPATKETVKEVLSGNRELLRDV